MAILGIRGNSDRCDEIMQLLQSLGGNDTNDWSGTDPNNIYYIHPLTNDIKARSLIVFDKHDILESDKYCKMTIEDFNSRFPWIKGDIVELKSDDNSVLLKRKYVVVSLRWDHVIDEVEYGLAEYTSSFDIPKIFRNADEIQYYQETDTFLTVEPEQIAKEFVFSLNEYKVEVDGDCIKVIKK